MSGFEYALYRLVFALDNLLSFLISRAKWIALAGVLIAAALLLGSLIRRK